MFKLIVYIQSIRSIVLLLSRTMVYPHYMTKKAKVIPQ